VLGTLTVETGNNNIRLLDSNDSSVNFSVGVNGLFQVRDINAGTKPFQIEKAAINNSLYIKANSNVGIGTSSPNSKLDVRRSGSGVALELIQTSGNANDFIDLKMIAGNTTAGTLGTILRHKRDGSGGGDFSILTNPTLSGTPTEKLIVKSGGNVGIGTTSPSHKLTVNAANNTTAVGIDFPSAHFDFSANSTSGYIVQVGTILCSIWMMLVWILATTLQQDHLI